ncbi:hypothetical protein C8F04DRAFT_1274128 [Mycena alexandri]|uniref:Uncharacterized protein n=1 Tax=Mycena alexandri TaxID=1745969 RepID=A0AAD6S5W9_9AGAR|nr:hypothetical protein C8F04DRAFT_1274128 [Mycena alexandri]
MPKEALERSKGDAVAKHSHTTPSAIIHAAIPFLAAFYAQVWCTYRAGFSPSAIFALAVLTSSTHILSECGTARSLCAPRRLKRVGELEYSGAGEQQRHRHARQAFALRIPTIGLVLLQLGWERARGGFSRTLYGVASEPREPPVEFQLRVGIERGVIFAQTPHQLGHEKVVFSPPSQRFKWVQGLDERYGVGMYVKDGQSFLAVALGREGWG